MQHPLTHKMADPSSLMKIPKSECPDIWMPRHKWLNLRSNITEPVVLLHRNLQEIDETGRPTSFLDNVFLGCLVCVNQVKVWLTNRESLFA